MDNLDIDFKILKKLRDKHKVVRHEVEECFLNREGNLLEDTRENNKTYPPTKWFISTTDRGRELKVVFIEIENRIRLKTAYEPNQSERRIYEKYA